MTQEAMKSIKAVRALVVDVDGTLTDGGMLYRDDGTEGKTFNVRDGAGIVLLRAAGIHIAIVSGEANSTIERRAAKLGIHDCFVGVKHKVPTVAGWLDSIGLAWHEAACVVDEINDLLMVRQIGFSYAAADASPLVLREVDFVLDTKGGAGVLRELAIHLLTRQGKLDKALDDYLASSRQG